LAIYQATQRFPGEEFFGLTLQMRRAGVSVPSNIAEGCERSGERELARFLNIAEGSISEVEYQLLLSHDLGYVTVSHDGEAQRDSISKSTHEDVSYKGGDEKRRKYTYRKKRHFSF
jgi:four helix bundle protein